MTTDNDPADEPGPTRGGLANYRPQYLSQAHWDVARDAATEVVDKARPADVTRARGFASRLCQLLAALTLHEWDRATPPDLARLLTEDRITAATSAESLPRVCDKTRRVYRTELRRLAAAARGEVREALRRPARASVASARFWTAASDLGGAAVLMTAYRSTGGRIHTDCWAGITADLTMDLSSLTEHVIVGAGTAIGVPAGSVAPVLAAAATLRSVTAPPSGVNPTMPKKPTDDVVERPPRTSRAAALRAAREAMCAHDFPLAAVGDLPAELEAKLSGWTPQGVAPEAYAAIEEAVVAAVRGVLADVRGRPAQRPVDCGSLRILGARPPWSPGRKGPGCC